MTGGPWEGGEAGQEVRVGAKHKIKQASGPWCKQRSEGPLGGFEHSNRQGLVRRES